MRYELMQVGDDRNQPGVEYKSTFFNEWRPWEMDRNNSSPSLIDSTCEFEYRRPLKETQHWISMKDRRPTKEDGEVLWLTRSGAIVLYWWDFDEKSTDLFWMPIPPLPKQPDPATQYLYREINHFCDCWGDDDITKAFEAGREYESQFNAL